MRHALRPLSTSARLRRLEAELRPYETEQERADRAMLTSWLAHSDDAAELWLDYQEAMEVAGGQEAMVTTPEGRAAMLAVAESLYGFAEGPD